MDLWPTLMRYDLISIPSTKTLVPNKTIFTGTVGLGPQHIFGGDTIQPTTIISEVFCCCFHHYFKSTIMTSLYMLFDMVQCIAIISSDAQIGTSLVSGSLSD